MRRLVAAALALSALPSVACMPDAPPITPLSDAGPRAMRDGANAHGGDGSIAPEDGAAPDADADRANEAGTDVGVGDAARADAPDCDGRADCDGDGTCETLLGTSEHCRSCDDRCAGGAAATSSCDPGRGCQMRCDDGFADCDGLASNGCEVATRSDPMHCGDCTTICGGATPGTRASCEAGVCTLLCTSGRSDCDGDVSDGGGNGCETDVMSSVAHCGSCETPCTLASSTMHSEPTCQAGLCQAQCSFGFADCDGDPLDGCEHVGPTCP